MSQSISLVIRYTFYYFSYAFYIVTFLLFQQLQPHLITEAISPLQSLQCVVLCTRLKYFSVTLGNYQHKVNCFHSYPVYGG